MCTHTHTKETLYCNITVSTHMLKHQIRVFVDQFLHGVLNKLVKGIQLLSDKALFFEKGRDDCPTILLSIQHNGESVSRVLWFLSGAHTYVMGSSSYISSPSGRKYSIYLYSISIRLGTTALRSFLLFYRSLPFYSCHPSCQSC